MYQFTCTSPDCPNESVTYAWDAEASFEVTCSGCNVTYTAEKPKAEPKSKK
jgi:ribosomal protein S27E